MFKLLLNFFSLYLFVKSIFAKEFNDKIIFCIAGWAIYGATFL